jgi:DNA polymerase delta subunit 2
LHQLAGDKAKYVERVLDVRQGELCWVVGTVYMEMALKPNVLDDITKEVRVMPLQRSPSQS